MSAGVRTPTQCPNRYDFYARFPGDGDEMDGLSRIAHAQLATPAVLGSARQNSAKSREYAYG